MAGRRGSKSKSTGPASGTPSTKPGVAAGDNVVQLDRMRSVKIANDRRKAERYFLRDLVQVFCVLESGEKRKLLPIELLEASATGCSFRIPVDGGKPAPELQDVKLRFYFSSESFLPIEFTVKDRIRLLDGGRQYARYGCAVNESFQAYPAYLHFVTFIGVYARHSKVDHKRAAG